VTIYRKVLEIETADAWIIQEIERELADITLALGKVDEALAAYDKIITKYEKDPHSLATIYNSKIDALRNAGRKEEAIRIGKEAIALFKDHPKKLSLILCSQARLYRELGLIEEAQAAFQSILDLESSAEDWTLQEAERGLAEIALENGKVEEALAAYDKMIAENKNNPLPLANAYHSKIDALHSKGRLEEALEATEEAIIRLTNQANLQARILCTQARLYQEMGRAKESEAAFRKVLTLESAESWTVQDAERGIAEMALAQGKVDEAITLYDKMIAKHKNKPQILSDAYHSKIGVLRGTARLSEALEVAGEAIPLLMNQPNLQARIICAQARILQDLDHIDEAKDAYQKALALNPSEAWVVDEAERGLADVAIALGKTDEALVIYNAMIAKHKDNPQALANDYQGKIGTLQSSGRKTEAIEAGKEATALLADHPGELARILCSQARLYRDMGSIDEAKAAYRKVLDLDPTDIWTRQEAEQGLAEIDLSQEKYDEALAAFKKIITKYKDNPQITVNAFNGKIAALQLSGRAAKAIEAANEAVDLHAGHPNELARALFTRARLHGETDSSKKAKADYEKILELNAVDQWIVDEAKRGLSELPDE